MSFSSHIKEVPNGFSMRVLIAVLFSIVILARVSAPSTAASAQICTDDYMTVDTFYGTILEVVPAPDPFSSADILLKGPENCTPMWMQVLKSDAAQ